MLNQIESKELGLFADFPDFSKTRVLVIGDIMLDSYWYGDIFRISPEAPVSVVNMTHDENRLGGAANVALNVLNIGGNCFLSGVIGDDNNGDKIESLIRNSDIDWDIERVSGSRTINKLRILSRNQQLIRLDFEDKFPDWNSDRFIFNLIQIIKNFDSVILSDYGKGTLRNPQELIEELNKLGKSVIVDPKGIDFEKYRGATLITPNLAEFEAVVGPCTCDFEINERGSVLRDRLDLKALLVTRGEKGMTLLEKDKSPLNLATQAMEVFDVTGAGDTVIATIGVCLAAGVPMNQSVYLSNIAAGLVVGKIGTATVNRIELLKAFESSGKGLYDWADGEEEVLNFLNKARAQGFKIVMTNGCFDILHPGHLDYLQKARKLGDILIVAVNDDDSVRRLKGESRPINTIKMRLKMLSGLSSVDRVLPFSEDTPERIYKRFIPDVLVKGGDYKEDDVIGGDVVKGAGGKVVVLDYLSGFSTSEIISKVKKS